MRRSAGRGVRHAEGAPPRPRTGYSAHRRDEEPRGDGPIKSDAASAATAEGKGVRNGKGCLGGKRGLDAISGCKRDNHPVGRGAHVARSRDNTNYSYAVLSGRRIAGRAAGGRAPATVKMFAVRETVPPTRSRTVNSQSKLTPENLLVITVIIRYIHGRIVDHTISWKGKLPSPACLALRTRRYWRHATQPKPINSSTTAKPARSPSARIDRHSSRAARPPPARRPLDGPRPCDSHRPDNLAARRGCARGRRTMAARRAPAGLRKCAEGICSLSFSLNNKIVKLPDGWIRILTQICSALPTRYLLLNTGIKSSSSQVLRSSLTSSIIRGRDTNLNIAPASRRNGWKARLRAGRGAGRRPYRGSEAALTTRRTARAYRAEAPAAI
ncbi:hypothetical protein EVAR_59799_1 [Eumeta japonica]|uniref:Uncharacterized protein n=1 Tax=Eumeta variegata TaxID=151549 RepID=A0A4C1YGW8_EUMVA|nr:hypothetical protein EVAR_59799_1 [Eumeta japonica]